MITRRRLLADLCNLSNGVLYYPILITFAWLTYNSVFSEREDKDLQVVAPLLALFVGSLVSIATERQDRIADRITVEMGGHRPRLLVRMVSLSLVNTLLVSLGLAFAFLQHGHIGRSANQTALTALVVILIISTLGVLVSSYIPHPLVAIVATFFLMSWGGADPENNWGLGQLLSMLRADNINDWFGAALGFTAPWLLCSAGLATLSMLTPRLGIFKRRVAKRTRANIPQVPSWLNTRRSFIKTVFFAGFTNPLPLVALVTCLGLYSYGTVRLAAEFSALSIGSNIFAALPGLLFANVIPALILAGTAQRREAVDQESLLYQSQRVANTSQILQQTLFVFVTLTTFIAILARLMDVSPSTPVVTLSILWALLLSPGFATIGVYLNRIVRLPIISGVVSYLITLPEIFLARWVPETRPYLPSSMFAILVGGDSGYTNAIDPPAAISAYVFAGILVTLPFLALRNAHSHRRHATLANQISKSAS